MINIKTKIVSNKMEYLKVNGIQKQKKIYLHTPFNKNQAIEYRKLKGRYYKKKNYWVFPSTVFDNEMADTDNKIFHNTDKTIPSNLIKESKEECLEKSKEECLEKSKEECLEESKEECLEKSKEEYLEESKEEYLEESKEEYLEESKEEYLEESKEEYYAEESKEDYYAEESKEEYYAEESKEDYSRINQRHISKKKLIEIVPRKYLYKPESFFYDYVKNYQTLLSCF